jgi:hypothetical protein
VLDALNASVLDPVAVEQALRDLTDALRQQACQRPEVEAARRAQLAEVDAQLGRLTEAITLGAGRVPTLVKQLAALQRQRDQLADALAMATMTACLPRDLRGQLEHRLADWRTAMARNVQQARQLLRRLLVGRLVFTPTPAGVEFVGQVTLGNLLAGIAVPKAMVSRPGLEPGTP